MDATPKSAVNAEGTDGLDGGESTDISVCIANYNGAAVLRECLESVVSQVTAARVEVLVFDDASSDDSASIAETQFPEVLCIRSETNVGFSRANNLLTERASGRFLLFLNNDAFLEGGALEALWRAAADHPEAILTLRQLDAVNGELLDLGMGMDMLTVPFPLREPSSPRLVTCIGACLWLRADLFREAEGFPEWFESVAEDLYLCQFARLSGHSIRVLEDHAYRHHSGLSFGGGKADQHGQSTSYRRRFLSERNRCLVFLIFFPKRWLIPLVPVWLLGWLAEGILLSLRHRSLRPLSEIYAPALRGVWRALPAVRNKRRYVQQRRKISFGEFLAPFSWMPTKLRFLLQHGIPRLR